MITINPHTFYTRADLLAMWQEVGLDWDALCGKLKPKKISGRGWWGKDLIEALDKAEETESRRKVVVPTAQTGRRGKRMPNMTDIALAELGYK